MTAHAEEPGRKEKKRGRKKRTSTYRSSVNAFRSTSCWMMQNDAHKIPYSPSAVPMGKRKGEKRKKRKDLSIHPNPDAGIWRQWIRCLSDPEGGRKNRGEAVTVSTVEKRCCP